MNKVMNLVPVAALTLVACGGFTPAQGTWTSTSITVNSDDCAIFGEVETIEVDMSLSEDEATMTFDLGDGVTTDCALESGDFDCTAIVMEDALDGVDATLTISQTISGSFEDEHNGEVTVDASVSCEGADCEAVAAAVELTLPCASSATATMAHSM